VSNGATNFECIAEDLNAEFLPTGPFDEVLDYIDFLNGQA